MAKAKSAGGSIKINFGKHDRSEKNYRGQGR